MLLVFLFSIDCELLFYFILFVLCVFELFIEAHQPFYHRQFGIVVEKRMKSSRCTNKLTVTLFIAFMYYLCVCVSFRTQQRNWCYSFTLVWYISVNLQTIVKTNRIKCCESIRNRNNVICKHSEIHMGKINQIRCAVCGHIRIALIS